MLFLYLISGFIADEKNNDPSLFLINLISCIFVYIVVSLWAYVVILRAHRHICDVNVEQRYNQNVEL